MSVIYPKLVLTSQTQNNIKMKVLNSLWNSVKTTKAEVITLAEFINQGLSKEDHVIITELSATWYLISGNDTAKIFYNNLIKAIEPVEC